jgi:outer membrane protein
MKRILVPFVVISLILFSSIVLASEGSRFGIGVRGGFVFSVDDSTTDVTDGTRVDIDIDSSFSFGINTTYVMSDVLSMELSADYVLDRDTEFTTPGQSMRGGEISTIPLLWTLRIHIPTNSGFKPYIGGGVGWYFNSFDQDPSWTALNPGVNVDLDDSFAWHANAGLELFFTENVALNLDAKYIWSKPDLNMAAPGYYQTYEIDLDGFVVGVGLKIYFQ